MSPPSTRAVANAILRGDMKRLARMEAAGADLNAIGQFAEPLIFEAVREASNADDQEDRARRLKVVDWLIAHGADTAALPEDGGSILVDPIFAQASDVLEHLLGSGVDPNHGCGEPWETVLSLAIFDYHYESWIAPNKPLFVTDYRDYETVDEYLAALGREAKDKGYPSPKIPLLLRKSGALTSNEVATNLGGAPDQPVRWTGGGWALTE